MNGEGSAAEGLGGAETGTAWADSYRGQGRAGEGRYGAGEGQACHGISHVCDVGMRQGVGYWASVMLAWEGIQWFV